LPQNLRKLAGMDPGPSSAPAEEGSFTTPTWRIVLLFFVVLIIDTAWEAFDDRVTRRIRERKSKGLAHAWEQLKFEVMALGLISLLLVVFEVRNIAQSTDKKCCQLQAMPQSSPASHAPLWC
jgi:Mlo family